MCVSRLDGARHQWDALGTEDLGMKTRLLLGTVWLGVACSSGETAPTQSGRPSGDGFGVRVAGGEASDFGNGEQEICAGTSMSTVLTEQEAEEAGLDVEADRALLAMPHVATLRWNPVECEAEPELCEPTELELHAQVVEPILLKVERSHPDSCPEEDQHFAYRVAVSIESEDGNIAGTFYDTVIRDESEDGVVTFRGGSWPHLWNFEGDLPIELDLARSHYAYLSISFALASDGSAAGHLEPKVGYYGPPSTDGGEGAAGAAGDDDSWRYDSPRIGPNARFGPQEEEFDGDSVLALDGERSTLTTYPGSTEEPLVALEVRADAVEPAADVDLTIWVDGERVYDESVVAGTLVDLGRHPLGTPVVVDVHNSNGAGAARANVLQDSCFTASSSCTGEDCTAHVEYTAAHHFCID